MDTDRVSESGPASSNRRMDTDRASESGSASSNRRMDTDRASEIGSASSYVYCSDPDRSPAPSIYTAWTYGRPPARSPDADTICASSPRSPARPWTPWDTEIQQTSTIATTTPTTPSTEVLTPERIQMLHAAGVDNVENPWEIIDHLLMRDLAIATPTTTSTSSTPSTTAAVDIPWPANAACAAEPPSHAAQHVAPVDSASGTWSGASGSYRFPPSCAAEPPSESTSGSYPPLHVACAREQPKPKARATQQHPDASSSGGHVAARPPPPPPPIQVAVRPQPPSPSRPLQIDFVMPTSALAVVETEEQLPPPVHIELTPNALSNLRGVLHEANMWITEAELLEFASWFGVPNSQQRFGSLTEVGMVRLAARYLRQSRWNWYLRQCEGPLRWGWWLSPYVLSKTGSREPPTSQDYARWPCVYFFMDCRWWMVCLHLLWYDNRGWETHIQRLTPW